MLYSLKWILDHKWAITESALQCIQDIVTRSEISSKDIAEAIHGSKYEKYLDAGANGFNPQAIFANKSAALEGAERVSMVGRVAVVPIIGPIFPRANMLTEFSGATSLQQVAFDFNAALESNLVESIILNIDSPGGEVTGISEFSEMIFNARNKKDITAHIFGFGASAAYWIASAASEIVINETAEAGSIGTVAGFVSTKEADEKKGIKRTAIVSSQSPNKKLDIDSSEGRAQIQKIVDDITSVFISNVARNRGVKTEKVLADFGQGNMFVGQTAVDQGLADRLGNLESIINLKNNSLSNPTTFLTRGSNMDKETLKAQHPETYNAIFADGKAEGVVEGKKNAAEENKAAIKTAGDDGAKAENSRIKEIEEIDAPGMEAVISESKFDMTQTKSSISAAVLQKQSDDRKAKAGTIKKDGEKLGNQVKSIGDDNGDTDGYEAERQAMIKAGAEAGNQYRPKAK